MKKISFVCILFLLCCLKSAAQIQLTNSIPGNNQFYRCTNTDGTQLFIGYPKDNKFMIYNADFSLNREVTLNIPNLISTSYMRINGGDGDVYYATNHLFNSDNLLEFVVRIKDPISGKSGFAVVNENNVILLSIYCENATDNPDKCIFYSTKTRFYLAASLGSTTKLYSLPGTERFDGSAETTSPTSVKEIASSVTESPFPNPARTTVKLTYTLPEGTKGTIQVYDVNGKILNSLVVNGAFPYLDLDITNYTAGTYLYTVQEGNSVISSGKFLVAK